MLSLGATKNGALSAEAIVAFDDRIAEELVYRTKRSGHVTSKMRFQSAQLAAYLTDGLWLRLAAPRQPADGRARRPSWSRWRRTACGCPSGSTSTWPSSSCRRPRSTRRPRPGLLFYRMGETSVRLVTSWQTTPDDVSTAAATFRAAVAAVA